MAQNAEFTAWLEKLKTEADDNLKPSVQAVINDDKLRERMQSAFMAQSDYTRKTQELATKKSELEATVEKLRNWYNSEAPKNEALTKKLQDAEAKLAKVNEKIKREFLEEGGEEINTNPGTQTVDPTKWVPKEEYQKLVEKVNAFDKNALAFNLDLSTVQRRMAKENFDLEVRDIYTFAAQNKCDLITAYETMTAEDRAKRAQADMEKKIKEAEERGAKSALSKHNLPDSPGRDVAPSLINREGAITDPMKRREAALAAFLEKKA